MFIPNTQTKSNSTIHHESIQLNKLIDGEAMGVLTTVESYLNYGGETTRNLDILTQTLGSVVMINTGIDITCNADYNVYLDYSFTYGLMSNLIANLRGLVRSRRTYTAADAMEACLTGNVVATYWATLQAVHSCCEAIGSNYIGITPAISQRIAQGLVTILEDYITAIAPFVNSYPILPNFQPILDCIGFKPNVRNGISVLSVPDVISTHFDNYRKLTVFPAFTDEKFFEKLEDLSVTMQIIMANTRNHTTNVLQFASDMKQYCPKAWPSIKEELDFDHFRDNILNTPQVETNFNDPNEDISHWEIEAIEPMYSNYTRYQLMLQTKLEDLDVEKADVVWNNKEIGNMIRGWQQQDLEDLRADMWTYPVYIDKQQDELKFEKCLGMPYELKPIQLADNNLRIFQNQVVDQISCPIVWTQTTQYNMHGTEISASYGSLFIDFTKVQSEIPVIDRDYYSYAMMKQSLMTLGLPFAERIFTEVAGVDQGGENLHAYIDIPKVPPYDKDQRNLSFGDVFGRYRMARQEWFYSFDLNSEPSSSKKPSPVNKVTPDDNVEIHQDETQHTQASSRSENWKRNKNRKRK